MVLFAVVMTDSRLTDVLWEDTQGLGSRVQAPLGRMGCDGVGPSVSSVC